jgi:hypothetical protein
VTSENNQSGGEKCVRSAVADQSHRPQYLTVAALRKALEGVPGDYLVRVTTEDSADGFAEVVGHAINWHRLDVNRDADGTRREVSHVSFDLVADGDTVDDWKRDAVWEEFEAGLRPARAGQEVPGV